MRGTGLMLQFLSVAALGVFAGGMLTEGFVLVPYWRSLAAPEFFAWYAANDERLLGFFGPLTTVAAVAAMLAALVAMLTGAPGRWFALLAALLVLAAVAMFPLYFQGANASFSAASIAAADLPAELARWDAWHRVRIAISALALVASLMSLASSKSV